jgi:hypothetical protein
MVFSKYFSIALSVVTPQMLHVQISLVTSTISPSETVIARHSFLPNSCYELQVTCVFATGQEVLCLRIITWVFHHPNSLLM